MSCLEFPTALFSQSHRECRIPSIDNCMEITNIREAGENRGMWDIQYRWQPSSSRVLCITAKSSALTAITLELFLHFDLSSKFPVLLLLAISSSPFSYYFINMIDMNPSSLHNSAEVNGTQEREEAIMQQNKERLVKIAGAVRTILECIGEDPNREGLLRTPERYARALLFFTKGYGENLHDITNGALFSEDYHELVLVRDIEIFSLCEHHLVPFVGKVSLDVLVTTVCSHIDRYILDMSPTITSSGFLSSPVSRKCLRGGSRSKND